MITVIKKEETSTKALCQSIEGFLESKKAQDMVRVDLAGKSSMADFMLIASGTSSRHIKTLAEMLKEFLHQLGIKSVFMEGTNTCDWVLVDAGDVIIHLFRPEVREFYNLEKMWGVELADFARQANQAIKIE